jgi:hypothetical protein
VERRLSVAFSFERAASSCLFIVLTCFHNVLGVACGATTALPENQRIGMRR